MLKSEIKGFDEVETIPLRRAYARISKDKVDVFIADVSNADLDVFDLLVEVTEVLLKVLNIHMNVLIVVDEYPD